MKAEKKQCNFCLFRERCSPENEQDKCRYFIGESPDNPHLDHIPKAFKFEEAKDGGKRGN